ncbi:GGDEF domain-containing protein [Piscinibacter sp. XHJ-5]|uniref:GGDEF domain-containing protein n=1 Tax=Piscinibacter sp. XHJ-5 TaxID=3037797 RepID=UPI0024528E59|nr:GGDEF domain-containing protein [Piscinibacter sp. XHJ-5]
MAVSSILDHTPDHPIARARARQGLLDLAKRGDRGIFVHLPLWLLISLWTGLWTQQPLFCAFNSALFLGNALARQLLRQRFARMVEADYARAFRVYMTLLLGNCLHWGVLTGLSMHWPALHAAEMPLVFVAVGVGCSGSLGLAISPFVRFWYPAGVLAPLAVALLTDPTALHTLIALVSVVLVPYLYRSSQVVHDDYWAAADARLELEERARQLELLSVTDALTQVNNRLYFEHRLVAEWARAARESEPLSVLIIDLDHFKNINDSHGHPFGDRCLVAAAQALRGALHRSNDVLARYGGEEFAVLLAGADARAAQQVAERLLAGVAAVELDHEGKSVRLACSIGVSTIVPASMSSPSSAVSEADKALYAAKQQGRNRVVAAPGA